MAIAQDLISAGLSAITGAIDAGIWGGKLEKAQIVPVTVSGQGKNAATSANTSVSPITFMYNPASVKWTVTPQWRSTRDAASDSADKTYGGNEGRTLTLSNIIFDTFEKRSSVRTEFIDKLEKLALRDNKDQHDPPFVIFTWGNFGNQVDIYNCPPFKVTSLDVEYTMFLNDGTPVRAKVNVTLKEARPEEQQAEMKAGQSPDHAKLVTMRRGDTLQSIAYQEYDDPREWRRIADANGLEDPMNVKPGTKLVVPPILV